MPLATIPDAYARMMAEDRHDHPVAFLHACDQMFEGVPLEGRQVLEIGSGTGLLSIYLALHGAHVTSLEPELVGSTSGVIAKQRKRCQELGLDRVEVVAADFNTWDTDAQFDVIVCRSAINHLYASDRHALRHPPTFEAYLAVAAHVRRLLRPNGTFIATDACRYNFWLFVSRWIKQPWNSKRTGVNWRHHQNAPTWRRIFERAGFTTRVTYPVPYRLRTAAAVAATPVGSFFLQGHFCLHASTLTRGSRV